MLLDVIDLENVVKRFTVTRSETRWTFPVLIPDPRNDLSQFKDLVATQWVYSAVYEIKKWSSNESRVLMSPGDALSCVGW